MFPPHLLAKKGHFTVVSATPMRAPAFGCGGFFVAEVVTHALYIYIERDGKGNEVLSEYLSAHGQTACIHRATARRGGLTPV